MWKEMQLEMEKGKWYTLQSIYQIIQNKLPLQNDDWNPAALSTDDPRWHRNIRNILQYRKKTDEIVWSGDARYMLPFTTDPVVATSSVPVKGGLSEKEFQLLQQRRYEIGQFGELYIVKYEKTKLIDAGKQQLANKVKRMSVENIGLGYDILSFYPDGREKYIEVKTTSGVGSTFELTANELKTSERYRQQYWIYFVRDIGGSPKVEEIKDPFSQIGKKLILEPTAFSVRLHK
jgi:hypothetical protein